MTLLGYEPSGYGEYWQITTHDVTNGHQTTLLWYTGTGWPHFTHAVMAAYEVHGLYACDGLSSWGAVTFELDSLLAWAPTWNSYADATGSLSWSAFGSPRSVLPYCNWSTVVSTSGGYEETELLWSP